MPFLLGHRVHHVVQAVIEIHVGAAGRAVERRVARRSGRPRHGRPDRPRRCRPRPRRSRRRSIPASPCRRAPCRSDRARRRASGVDRNRPAESRHRRAELGEIAARLVAARLVVERPAGSAAIDPSFSIRSRANATASAVASLPCGPPIASELPDDHGRRRIADARQRFERAAGERALVAVAIEAIPLGQRRRPQLVSRSRPSASIAASCSISSS